MQSNTIRVKQKPLPPEGLLKLSEIADDTDWLLKSRSLQLRRWKNLHYNLDRALRNIK